MTTSSAMYAELAASHSSPDGYIVPVTDTGRTSGWMWLVVLPMGIEQWVHVDHILFDEDVESA
jgi:hypothetical protein